MKALFHSTEAIRENSLHLHPYTGSQAWLTFQYAEPYIFLNKLPAGLLYIHNAPPGLGRSSAIRTLSSTHDILVPTGDQLWLSHPDFPYSKDSLVIKFDFSFQSSIGLSGVFSQVSREISRFLVKYRMILQLNTKEDLINIFQRITAGKNLEVAISTLMKVLEQRSRLPLICLIDSLDDTLLAAWCHSQISKTDLQAIIDELHTFCHHFASFLSRDGETGRLQKIFVFGTTSGFHTLFSGIPLQDLTGNANLKGLLGLRCSELKTLVEMMVPSESQRGTALVHLRSICREYTFHDQNRQVSEPVYYAREVFSELGKMYGSPTQAVSQQPSLHDLVKSLCRFIKDKLRQKNYFSSHGQHLLAFKKQAIDTGHLLDDGNVSPTLLRSLLVDFGFYKASTLDDASKTACYILHRADLLELSANFSVELIIDRVLTYLRLFPERAADLRYEETLQFSLKWLFPELDIVLEVAVYNNSAGFLDLFIITDNAYFIVELKNLALERLNITAQELRDVSDLSQLSYTSLYPPGGNGRRLSALGHFKVGELMNSATKQVLRYAEAIRRGDMPRYGARFSSAKNNGWVTISANSHKKDIPIYPLVIILLGGTRILPFKLEPMTTRVRYVPGPKVKEWRSFLKTLNYF